ncbi:YhcH/YjgK/YiaL family protein [Clostridium estertheticum]|uniref:YhcH/YjgK/YiaL family protein n=1 Tax=Clostridium estertheticum TaxID=238834 RepID=UPI001C0AF557|nr:YhcH/YjgK/YiaL family protein [Clostridium estertheticum]MBU3199146.1 YhcH/YjgK/YiaL family protein [Clostridium estertheticum]WAG63593.1 YhcH/YjgK/YiaL family protein [Clostridium estertheticum]
MIFSSIYSKDDVTKYPIAIQTAIKYLKENDFTTMKVGVYEIQGKDIYAQVFDAQTEPYDKKRPEVHEKYVDVQFIASGKERLGFTPDMGKYEVDERIDDRDLIFYKGVENEGFIEATPGCYCIFFPSDVHRPAVMAEEAMIVRKVVVKVKVALLK